MKSIGFSASNKSQSGPAGRATLGRTSSVVVPKTAKGKIDFSQVAQLREEITTKRAEEDKKRRQGDLDFAVQQLELVGFNDVRAPASKGGACRISQPTDTPRRSHGRPPSFFFFSIFVCPFR